MTTLTRIQIIPGPYLAISDPSELARHLFESIRPGLADQIKPGDIIVAGKGFGCGSSREHAVHAILASGISFVIARASPEYFIGIPSTLGCRYSRWLILKTFQKAMCWRSIPLRGSLIT